ncbi:SURF1-domain-containing protein [Tothia fuscella]|uniref:SURF1-like protein n=1 Tax=Tothia fuscella TaxID=1048955 RepID=A0A9P4NMF9_9PEZI|nr:SURF1-domain-containing protein [Tothia fuscella]
MNNSGAFLRQCLRNFTSKRIQFIQFPHAHSTRARWRLQCANTFKKHQRRFYQNPADNPNFTSIVDEPAVMIRSGRKHGPGLIILALMPITAFALGTWQVQRLNWKSDLIARFEDRLIRDPLPLPPAVDPDAISEFDYRRVTARGHFRHDQEMLIGPRIHEGEDGFLVVTPLERSGGSTILINRGWIPKKFKLHKSRPEGLPQGEVTVEGLLREPWKPNMFTPKNAPEKDQFYFPDVAQMAGLTGAQPVWVEETMDMNLLEAYRREEKGIPIGRPAEVNLRNNHAQYIFTWYALGVATTVMLYMIVRKQPSEVTKRVRRSTQW